MLKQPEIQKIQLPANHYLTDLNPKLNLNQHRSVIHLGAWTGTGKSTLVLDQMILTQPVVMAVPQRAQVEQLKAKYKDSKEHCFLHGETKLPENLDRYRAIVGTYDALERIAPRVRRRRYSLVIDEAHKLYQAAGYRSKAVTKLVELAQSKHFKSVVTLSAKLNPKLMPFDYTRIIEVQTAPTEKSLDLLLFEDGQRLREQFLKARPTKPKHLVMLRVNNKKEIEEYAEYYQRQGLKVHKVTSDLQKTEAVAQTFTTEVISDEYDIVLTTSLMDEAININNTNIESVHILGDRLHREELLQIIGRFRNKTPPIHQYLTKSMLGKPKINLEEQRSYLIGVAEAFKLACERAMPVVGFTLTLEQLNHMCELNFGVPLLHRVKINEAEGRIVVNMTGINNLLYRMDTDNHYHSKNTLVHEYKRAIPGLKVFVTRDSTKKASQDFEEIMGEVQQAFLEKKQQLINDCAEAIGYEEVKEEYEHPQMVEDYCVTTDPNTEEGKLARLWRHLSRRCLQHQDQIKWVLEQEVEQQVIQYVNHAKENPLVLAMLLEMKRIPSGTVMNEKEAKRRMITGLQQLFKIRPDIKGLLRVEDDRSNIWIKTNNHIEISDRLVRRFYREFTNTEVVRSNSKYKFKFQSAFPFDLRYRVDYLKYTTTPEGEKELLSRVSSTTEYKRGFKMGSPKPKRKKRK